MEKQESHKIENAAGVEVRLNPLNDDMTSVAGAHRLTNVPTMKQTSHVDAAANTAHTQWLIERHGTANLEPLPDMTLDDPLNWSKGKKVLNISLVAFHAMMATFTAAAIQSAFVNIAEDLHISVQQASYLTSLVIAILGGAPLFWRPLAHTWGRRPVFLVSLICSLVGNVGCAVSHSYGTMGLCRAIAGFFISPAASIGSGVVSEMFFRTERAFYMGIWTTMVTLGVPVAPFIFGFVALRVDYRWIYWILAIINAVQFLLLFTIGSETRYLRRTGHQGKTSWWQSRLSFRRIDPTPLRFWDFIQPLSMVVRPCVIIPACAYAMVFLWASIMISIEIPQIYPEKFGLNTQQVGLQYLSFIIGTILGEQIGGITSDKWMYFREKKTGRRVHPEYRLWLSYLGYLTSICGIIVFLVQTDNASENWNVTPLVGAAIASAGNQMVTTVLITYAVDCYPEDGASVGVFITFVRQIWGFIGPFWFPDLIEDIGLSLTSIVAVVMILVVSILPTIPLQWRGFAWHPHAVETA